MNFNIYKDKTVLVTGHTGFKGSWLCIWLKELGAKIIGYSLDPQTPKDNFVLSKIGELMIDIRADINDSKHLEEVILTYKPDFIFHLAAQPLVKLSFEIPQQTFQTNIIGTINILEPLRKLDKKVSVVIITTDKVYENNETGLAFVETDRLGGYDPYSASKACAEIAVSSYCNCFFNKQKINDHKKFIATVRAGNVIGGGDWSKDRLIPDCIRYIEQDEDIKIRNPKSVRPWQFVLEPLYGYLILGEKLYLENPQYCTAYNFGPDEKNIVEVGTIIDQAISVYGMGQAMYSPENNQVHEAKLLTLNSAKAKKDLNWHDIYTYPEALEQTIEWYKSYKTKNIYLLCVAQIHRFIEKAREKN